MWQNWRGCCGIYYISMQGCYQWSWVSIRHTFRYEKIMLCLAKLIAFQLFKCYGKSVARHSMYFAFHEVIMMASYVTLFLKVWGGDLSLVSAQQTIRERLWLGLNYSFVRDMHALLTQQPVQLVRASHHDEGIYIKVNGQPDASHIDVNGYLLQWYQTPRGYKLVFYVQEKNPWN